jgi:hypothetical protein
MISDLAFQTEKGQTMKRLTTILFSLVLAASALAQATKPDSAALPSVDQVLEKNIKAQGGKDAITKITSRHQKGTFEFAAAGAGGSAEFLAKAPNKSTFTIDIAGYGTVREGFNGSTAWAQSPDTGLRDKSGAELADAKRDDDFYRDLRLKDLYPALAVKGKEKVGTKDAYVLEGPRAEGTPDKFYFDAETGIMIRADVERESAQGKVAVQMYFEDFKEVDGVKLPHTMRQVTPMGEFVIKITETKHNVPIDDAKFNKPAAQ